MVFYLPYDMKSHEHRNIDIRKLSQSDKPVHGQIQKQKCIGFVPLEFVTEFLVRELDYSF